MSFDGFDFTDFRVPTPLSSDLSERQGPESTGPNLDAPHTNHVHSYPANTAASLDFPPQTLRQDLFIHDGSSSDNEGDGDETSSCCSSSTYYRSRSHSIAFFGDNLTADSTHSLPLTFATFEQQTLTQPDMSTLTSVHMSHIFDPTAQQRHSTPSSPRRSSICAYPIHGMPHSSSEPSSPVKKRMSISSNTLLVEGGLSESSLSSSLNPSSSDERSPILCDRTSYGHRRHSVSASSLEVLRCPFEGCGKMFSRRYNLETHIRVHTGERPFVCSVCGLSFARNHDLRRHERIHVPEREFSCAVCCKLFSRQDALRRHERSNSCVNLADVQSAVRRELCHNHGECVDDNWAEHNC